MTFLRALTFAAALGASMAADYKCPEGTHLTELNLKVVELGPSEFFNTASTQRAIVGVRSYRCGENQLDPDDGFTGNSYAHGTKYYPDGFSGATVVQAALKTTDKKDPTFDGVRKFYVTRKLQMRLKGRGNTYVPDLAVAYFDQEPKDKDAKQNKKVQQCSNKEHVIGFSLGYVTTQGASGSEGGPATLANSFTVYCG